MVKIGNNKIVNTQCNPFPYMYQYNAWEDTGCSVRVQRVHGRETGLLLFRKGSWSFLSLWGDYGFLSLGFRIWEYRSLWGDYGSLWGDYGFLSLGFRVWEYRSLWGDYDFLFLGMIMILCF